MRKLAFWLLSMSAWLMAAPATTAIALERVALVIGNGDYAHTAPLPNPPNDARAVAEKLTALDFRVFAGIDLDQTGMRSLTRDFARALGEAEVGLVFYAGHGLQVNGENYLLPVDAALEHPSDLAFESLSLTDLMDQVEAAERTSIVILDACRNNPLSRSFQRKSRSANVGQGLARLSAGTGALIAFATAPGDVALDGTGANSPFTEALLAEIDAPGVEINQMMTRVRARVYASTGQDQLPWTNSALLGEFYFVPGDAPVPAVAAPSPDTLVWQAIQQSGQQGGDTTDLESFLASYPDSPFAPLARARLDKIVAEQQVAALQPGPESTAETGTTTGNSAALDFRVRTLDGIMGDGVSGRGFSLQGKADGLISDLLEAPSGLLVAAGVSIDPDRGTSEGWVAGLSQEGKLELQRYVGGFHTSWLSSVARLDDDIYVAAGAAAEGQSEPFVPWIVAFDLSGTVVWSRRLDAPAGGWLHDVVVADDGLLLSGYRARSRGGRALPSIWRADREGGLLEQHDLEVDSFGEARGILPLDDGSMLITGFLEEDAGGASDIALWRIDAGGKTIWSQRLESPMADRGVALARLDDGRAVAVGTREDAAVAMIVDIDNGEVASLVPLASSLERSWANAIGRRDDGSLVAVGAGLRSASESETVWLARLDPDGRASGQFIIDSQGDDEVYAVEIARDGRLFVAGLYGGERLFSVLMGGEPWIAELVTR